MRKVLLAVTACIFFVGNAFGQQGQFRFLIHPTQKFSENWGVAGWAVKNVSPGGGNLVLMAGIRYQNEKLWAEFMPCLVLATSRDPRPCFDTRTNVSLPKQTNFWFETQTFSDRLYWFAESNYSSKHWQAGVETENVHSGGRDSLGAGPHVKFRIADGIWVGPAYQFRRNEADVLRFYVVFHLSK